MHRWGQSALVVIALVGAGCGQADELEVGSPAIDVAAETVPTETLPTETVPVETVAMPVESTADSDELQATNPNEQKSQTELAGLSLDDPLPPQPDAVTDPAGAETAIRFAYEHWILIDLDAELRGRLMENGDEHAAEMAEGMTRQRVSLEGATISVEAVSIVDAEHADVSYQVYWYGHPSPYFPEPRTGEALLQGGTWRISVSTVCLLALGSGFGCPIQGGGGNPTPPQALRVEAVPNGLVREEPDFGDVLNMSTMGNWVGAGDSWITISYHPQPGVSKLSPEEADTLLMERTGGSGAVPVTVAGRPARYFRNLTELYGRPVEMFLVAWIRADDVIVQANVSNVPIEEVLSALESLTPTAPVNTI